MSIIDKMPERFKSSLETTAYESAMEKQMNELHELREEFFRQLNVDTATWGLTYWEQEFGVITDVSKPYDYRRSRIRAKMRGRGTTTISVLKRIAESFTNGQVAVEELKGQYKIIFWFTDPAGIPPNINDLSAAVREVIPAHIQYGFSYTYDTHEMLSRFTHAQLASMTHGQVRHDVQHQKLSQYTHHQLRLIKHG